MTLLLIPQSAQRVHDYCVAGFEGGAAYRMLHGGAGWVMGVKGSLRSGGRRGCGDAKAGSPLRCAPPERSWRPGDLIGPANWRLDADLQSALSAIRSFLSLRLYEPQGAANPMIGPGCLKEPSQGFFGRHFASCLQVKTPGGEQGN